MEQRAAHRFPTDITADCRTRERAWVSRLCNISTTGCMMVCPEDGLPDDDDLLRLRIKGLAAIDAEIVWQHRGHAGLRFLIPLHPASLEHLGFRLPEPRSFAATPVRTAGLHASLIKRTLNDDDAAIRTAGQA